MVRRTPLTGRGAVPVRKLLLLLMLLLMMMMRRRLLRTSAVPVPVPVPRLHGRLSLASAVLERLAAVVQHRRQLRQHRLLAHGRRRRLMLLVAVPVPVPLLRGMLGGKLVQRRPRPTPHLLHLSLIHI